MLGCVVRRAWQFDCKRFITNRGDIISAGFGDSLIECFYLYSAIPAALLSQCRLRHFKVDLGKSAEVGCDL